MARGHQQAEKKDISEGVRISLLSVEDGPVQKSKNIYRCKGQVGQSEDGTATEKWGNRVPCSVFVSVRDASCVRSCGCRVCLRWQGCVLLLLLLLRSTAPAGVSLVSPFIFFESVFFCDFRVARLTLQTRKLWLRPTETPAQCLLAVSFHFIFLVFQKKENEKKSFLNGKIKKQIKKSKKSEESKKKKKKENPQ